MPAGTSPGSWRSTTHSLIRADANESAAARRPQPESSNLRGGHRPAVRAGFPAQSDFVRRFELSNIPAGTKKIRVSFQGKVKSYDEQSLGLVHIDSLDACLVDPQVDNRFGCGGTAKPQQNGRINPDKINEQ